MNAQEFAKILKSKKFNVRVIDEASTEGAEVATVVFSHEKYGEKESRLTEFVEGYAPSGSLANINTEYTALYCAIYDCKEANGLV